MKGRRGRDAVRDPNPGTVVGFPPQVRRLSQAQGSSLRSQGITPHGAPPILGICTGKMSPYNVWL